MDKKLHWENIYQTKQPTEVSWYQPEPTESFAFVTENKVPKTARIIDVGGGDSLFVDTLLSAGYQNVSVLDISETALAKAKLRLGELASKVNWFVSDILEFSATQPFDFWHDRAVFHFLTTEAEIQAYLSLVEKLLKPEGILAIGTFSENGPLKCSGIPVRQYSQQALIDRFGNAFQKLHCFQHNHLTPFQTIQNFTFCSFQKKAA